MGTWKKFLGWLGFDDELNTKFEEAESEEVFEDEKKTYAGVFEDEKKTHEGVTQVGVFEDEKKTP